jgi:hypothetical protein
MSLDSILAKSPSVIFRPGGVTGGLVVTTWAEVQTFIALRQGAVVVYVDDSIVSPALVPAASGVTDCQGRVEIRSYRQDELNFSTLVVQNGATLKNLYKINSTMVVLGDTQGVIPAFDWDYTPNVLGVPGPVLFIEHGFIGSTATATQPCITVALGHLLEFNISEMGGVSQGGATSILSVAGQFQAFMWSAELLGPGFGLPIGTNWISGTGQVFLFYDTDTVTSSRAIQPTAATTNQLVLLDAQAGAVIYKPGSTTAGSTVATWAEVQAYIRDHKGMVTVFVDDSIVSPALVPGASGVTNCQGRVTLQPFLADAVIFAVLQIEPGATLQDLYKIAAMELRCNPQTPVRSLTFTSVNGGFLFVSDAGFLSNAATATTPAIDVAAGKILSLDVTALSFVSNLTGAPAIPLVHTVVGATLNIFLFDGSFISPNIVDGAGTQFNLDYDWSSASQFGTPGTPPPQPGFTGAYNPKNFDDILNTQTFLANAANIFATGPFTGTRLVNFRGCGGGGAGGGGSAASLAGAPGTGGGAGGASMYGDFQVPVDFSHRIDIIIPAVLPTPGAGGAAPGNDGGTGQDGGTCYVLDTVTNTILCAFPGGSGGQGGKNGGTPGLGGANFPSGQLAGNLTTGSAGFVAAGGNGGNTTSPITPSPGNQNLTTFGLTPPGPAPNLFTSGAAGVNGAAGQGGGGGGGGQGPFGPGGAGGNGNAGAGTPGTNAPANSGAGAGGGGGGAIGNGGSPGGVGCVGQITYAYRP